MKKQEDAYLRFITSQNMNVEFDFKPINKNSVEQIVSALTEFVEEEENCALTLPAVKIWFWSQWVLLMMKKIQNMKLMLF